jgi:hypothetical protein
MNLCSPKQTTGAFALILRRLRFGFGNGQLQLCEIVSRFGAERFYD